MNRGAWDALRSGCGALLLASCTASTEPAFDYGFGGPCVTDASHAGVVGDVEVRLSVVPASVEYGVQFFSELSIRNSGVEEIRMEPQMEYCVEQVWPRGAGPRFATPTEPGVRADPGTYCASVVFRLGSDSILLEEPFELRGP